MLTRCSRGTRVELRPNPVGQLRTRSYRRVTIGSTAIEHALVSTTVEVILARVPVSLERVSDALSLGRAEGPKLVVGDRGVPDVLGTVAGEPLVTLIKSVQPAISPTHARWS